MKLSERTVSLLKNFAGINPSILIKPGNLLQTINPMSSVVATATVEESFPREFAIYDLNQFLSAISMFKSCDIEFGEGYLELKGEGNAAIRYWCAEPSLIKSKVSEVKLPSEDVKFHLSESALSKVLKAASILGLPELAFASNGHKLSVKAIDSRSSSSNSMDVELTENENGSKFNIIFQVDNLKMIVKDYAVTVCAKGITKFDSTGNEKHQLTYYVASSVHSTFTK